MTKRMGWFGKFLYFRADTVLVFILILISIGGFNYFTKKIPEVLTVELQRQEQENDINRSNIRKLLSIKIMPSCIQGQKSGVN